MGKREELGARIRDAVDKHSNNGSYSEMSQAFFGMDVAAHEHVEIRQVVSCASGKGTLELSAEQCLDLLH